MNEEKEIIEQKENLGTVILDTDKLLLRKFKVDDYISMYNNWASNSTVARRAGFPSHTSSDVTKKLIEFWVEGYKEKYTYNWIIEEKETGDLIGSITVVNKDIENRVCEIGYTIGEKWWNKGYATISTKTVIEFLFGTGYFDLIYANCHDYNIASARVLEKNNFKKEGVLRDRKIIENKKVSLIQYSIKKDEFIK